MRRKLMTLVATILLAGSMAACGDAKPLETETAETAQESMQQQEDDVDPAEQPQETAAGQSEAATASSEEAVEEEVPVWVEIEREMFGKELEEVSVASVEEFQALVDSGSINDKCVILTEKEYNFTSLGGITLKNISNVAIIGDGSTRIVADTGYDMVATLEDCSKIFFYGVTMTHDRTDNTNSMEPGVLFAYRIGEIRLYDCALTNGLVAFNTSQVNMICENTVFDNHVWQGSVGWKDTIVLKDCTFSNLGTNPEYGNPLLNHGDSNLTVENSTFTNCDAPKLYPEDCTWTESGNTYNGVTW